MKKYLLILATLILLVFIYLNRISSGDVSSGILLSSDSINSDSHSTVANHQQVTKQKVIEKKGSCDRNLQKKLLVQTHKLWDNLRNKLEDEYIKNDLIQIAIIQSPPHQGYLLYLVNSAKKQLEPDYYQKSLKASQLLSDLVQIVLSKGLDAALKHIEKENISLDVLQYNNLNGQSFLALIYELSKKTHDENSFPTLEKVEKLTNYGYAISEKDYLSMTENEASTDFLEAIIPLGPEPESFNRKYDEIPIDTAAKRGNRRLVDFWLKQNFIYPLKIKRKSFADILLLNSINIEEFLQNWYFLDQNNFKIRDPETAKTLLKRNFENLPLDIKNRLLSKSHYPYPEFHLTEDEQFIVDNIKQNISRVNHQIDIILQPIAQCIKLDKKLKFHLNVKDIKKLLEEGKSERDIVEKLSKINPFLVDKFKKDIINDKYIPFIKSDHSELESQLISSFLRVFSIISKNDLDEINQLISSPNTPNLDSILVISKANPNLPTNLINKIKQKITALPPQSYAITEWLTPEFLESHNIDPFSLNKVDQLDKNLFYYATKNNQPELMRWLVEHGSNLVSDQYGSDPMDMALKWNTHPETLKTLCDLNFPLKQKHKDKFQEIEQNHAEEAEEILQNCPMFGEQ